MERPKVSLYRTPRTGSTLAKRALAIVADFPSGQCGHEPFTPEARLVVTIRDWRDVLYSQWRIRYGYQNREATAAEIRCAMQATDKRLLQLDRMLAVNTFYTVWRYELAYNKPQQVAAMLEKIIERPLTCGQAALLADIVPVQAVLKTQAKLPEPERPHRAFDVWDTKTGIHKNHMGKFKGQPGSWRAFPANMHDEITTHYKPYLDRFGYYSGG